MHEAILNTDILSEVLKRMDHQMLTTGPQSDDKTYNGRVKTEVEAMILRMKAVA